MNSFFLKSLVAAFAIAAFLPKSSAQITAHGLPLDTCDFSNNLPTVWSAPAFWDPLAESHDLAESPRRIGIEVETACAGGEVSASFELFLDLDGNGSTETIVFSSAPSLRFGIADSTAGGKKYALVTRDAEDDAAFPLAGDRFFSTVQLPYGKHKIRWALADLCGATAVFEQDLVVRDCQKPVIFCKPLTVVVGNSSSGCSINIDANDLLDTAFDNHALDYGWLSIRKKGQAGWGSGQPPLTASGYPIVLGLSQYTILQYKKMRFSFIRVSFRRNLTRKKQEFCFKSAKIPTEWHSNE